MLPQTVLNQHDIKRLKQGNKIKQYWSNDACLINKDDTPWQ